MLFLGFLAGCNDDDSDVNFSDEIPPFVSFASPTTLSLDESSPALIDVEVMATPAPTSDLNVQYTVSGVTVGQDLNIVGSIIIPAGETSTTFAVQALDDDIAQTDNRPFFIELTSAPGYELGHISSDTYRKVGTIANDDCPLITEGTYSTSTVGTITNDYTVTITKIEDISATSAKFMISDITMGLYTDGYGASDNPGIFLQTSCGIEVLEAESPDVVYGGDAFFGSGTFDGGSTIQLSWGNSYGDNGVTTLTLN